MIDNLVFIQGSSSVLIPKSVTENGTYYASSDEADGYSSVAVNIPMRDLSKVYLSQSEYNQLSTADKLDPTRLYIIGELAYEWHYNEDKTLAVRENISDGSFRWYINGYEETSTESKPPQDIIPSNLANFFPKSSDLPIMIHYNNNDYSCRVIQLYGYSGYYNHNRAVLKVGTGFDAQVRVLDHTQAEYKLEPVYAIIESTDFEDYNGFSVIGSSPYYNATKEVLHEWIAPTFDPYELSGDYYYKDVLYQEAPDLNSKSVTTNGTYYANDDNLDGYSSVTVNVEPNVGAQTIVDNGTYYAVDNHLDGYSQVTVSLPLDSKSITTNGIYNASTDNLKGYSSVSVNVAPNVGTKSVTTNGTYNASSDSLDGYSSVTVNVPMKDLDKINLTQAEYDLLSQAQKEDPTKIYAIHTVIYNWYYNEDRSLTVRESVSDNSFRWYISNFEIDGYMPVPNNLSSFILNSVGANGFMEGYTENPNATIGFYDNTIRAWSIGLSFNIYGTVDSCIIESTDPNLDGNEPYHEWEEPDYNPYKDSGYFYYMDIRYKGEFPIEIESDNTLITTSSPGVTLEEGYHYLMTTIYSGGVFTNANIEAGATRVFNTDGYDRTIYIISTSATNISYSRTGGIDPNKFVKFRIKQNGEYVDDLAFTNALQSAWSVSQSPTITVEKGSYYMITYKASAAPNITNATPVCYAYIGETDAKKSISMIIKANEDSITINDYNTNYSYFYYQKLIY